MTERFQPQPHGTRARYKWELANLGQTCARCRDGNANYEREYRRRGAPQPRLL